MCGVPVRDKDGKPLRKDEKTAQRVATEGVKKVYQHTESRKTFRTEREIDLNSQREELADRFRLTYASANQDDSKKANVYPYFIGVFDTVAAVSNPLVATSMFLVALLVLAVLSAATTYCLNFSFGFWIWFGGLGILGLLTGFFVLINSLVRFEWGLAQARKWWPVHLTKVHVEAEETDLNTEVSVARHAISIDEARKTFKNVPWGGSYSDKKTEPSDWFVQQWFAGNHSDIGGSYAENESRLSDISLGWMLAEAVKAGLKYDASVLNLYPDHTGPQHDETRSGLIPWPRKLREIPNDAPLHPSVLERFKADAVLDYDMRVPYRPENLRNHNDVKAYYKLS